MALPLGTHIILLKLLNVHKFEANSSALAQIKKNEWPFNYFTT